MEDAMLAKPNTVGTFFYFGSATTALLMGKGFHNFPLSASVSF